MRSPLISRCRISIALGISLIAGWLAAPLNATESSIHASSPPSVTVFAAISMSEALMEAGKAFTRRTGVEVKYSFASSAQLARQIESGARVDVFISADKKWMEELRRAQRIDARTERQLAGNRLVLIQPASRPRVDPRNWASAIGRGRLATGDPDFVPLGRYAREALRALGKWQTFEPRLARAENSRVATLLVARGEAPLGIVYATDARAEPRVRVVTMLEPSLHSPIEYPAALTREAHRLAAGYLDFLSSPEGQKFFAKFGFEKPSEIT